MEFKATKQHVLNRGVPPDSFLETLVKWARSADESIFAVNAAPNDIYASVRPVLGPWESLTHRKAVMLEVMRVLAGFESSWNWNEGVDRNNAHSLAHIDGQETGAWQVSYDSLPFGADLKSLAAAHCSPLEPRTFIDEMKANHEFACEYIARLLRHTCRHNGPVLRHEIDGWLKRDSVAEFQALLS